MQLGVVRGDEDLAVGGLAELADVLAFDALGLVALLGTPLSSKMSTPSGRGAVRRLAKSSSSRRRLTS
jgi:hypothetical protein